MKTTKPENIKSYEIGEGVEMHEAYCSDYEIAVIMQDGTEAVGTVQIDRDEIIWDTLLLDEEAQHVCDDNCRSFGCQKPMNDLLKQIQGL